MEIPNDTLYDLIGNGVFCIVKLNTDDNANKAVTSVDKQFNAGTDDGQYFTFEVEFENETTEEFSVELDVDLEHLTNSDIYDI